MLRPGGSLALIWNVRDQRVEWVRRFVDLIVISDEHRDRIYDPRIGPPFGPLSRFDVEWQFELTRAQLIELASSRSQIIALPVAERVEVLERVGRLIDTEPELAGGGLIRLPYVTRTFVTRRD